MESPQNPLRWERLGELAAELATCAADCESFLAEQIDLLDRLEQKLSSRAAEEAWRHHPHGDDPVVAAVLAELAALRGAMEEAAALQAAPSP